MTNESRPIPPPRPSAPPRAAADKPKSRVEAVTFGQPAKGAGHRIVIYGPGGAGKTTLAATAPGPVAFFDLDDSLPVLSSQLGSFDIRKVDGIATWDDLRDSLHAPGWDGVKTVVVDSGTKAEELAVAYVIKTIPHEKGNKVERLEDYPYGRGYTFVYDTFLTLLSDLDAHVRAGRNVVLICHDCTATVPNPAGEDYLRYEPRLQSPSSGKASIRLRVREWADHVLFLGYDLNVVKDKDRKGPGKGQGSGTRTLYPCELPHCMAKSRTMADTLELVKFDAALWTKLLNTERS